MDDITIKIRGFKTSFLCYNEYGDNMETTWEKIKRFISNYSIFILLFLIVIVLVILLLPTKENKNNVTSTLTLTLKGNREVSIMKGEEYEEAGYTAYDSVEGDITNRVKVIGVVNKNVVGNYIIKYSITNKNGITKEEVRTINVVADLSDLSVSITYSPKEITNKDVTIELKISGAGYDFTLDPDGKTVKSNNVIYKVSTNDEYIFSVRRKDGTIIEKKVSINNIDKVKPIGSCKSVINGNKTEISVTASDTNGILKYSYNFNSKKEDSTKNKLTINEIARNAVVTVYDKAGNYELINCLTVDDVWPVKVSQDYNNYSTKNYNQNLKYEGRMNYIIYYPDTLDLSKKNPLVIYLHEVSGFGSNINNTIDLHGENKKIFTGNMRTGKFRTNAIYIAPQCSTTNNAGWKSCFSDLKGLIDYIVRNYNIDTKRISITGFSLGGAAIFDFISEYPGIFSAALALAPTWINKDYAKMKDLKIAVFTGTADGNHGINEPDVAYLKENGVNIKYFPQSGIGHLHIQHEVYLKTNAVDWMISQSK